MSMNDSDLTERLRAVADGFQMPPTPPADDINRGRRRVRRNRGLVTGGVALGLVSMVAAMSLFTGERSPDRPQPVDRSGLPTPLVLPKSLLDVPELGFHVEPVPGFVPQESWSLGPDYQGTQVHWTAGEAGIAVNVYYRGTSPELHPGTRQAVTVHGTAGTYVEEFRTDGHWLAQLVWEYAPNSWAEVVAANDHSPPPQASTRSAFLQIAEAVRSAGASVRLPFRVGTARGPLPMAADVSSVTMQPSDSYSTGGWEFAFDGALTLSLFEESTWCDPDAEPYGYGEVQPFTYRGYEGCVRPGTVDAGPGTVVLRAGGVDRVIEGSPAEYRVADLKRMLAELEVASFDDPATWFDVRTALGG